MSKGEKSITTPEQGQNGHNRDLEQKSFRRKTA